jgi:metal-responsive CopG/Arc/MetJ family transcriptional regulator
MKSARNYRLQVDMPEEEYRAIDDFWFRERLPTRAAAVRELLRRGLARDREENPN